MPFVATPPDAAVIASPNSLPGRNGDRRTTGVAATRFGSQGHRVTQVAEGQLLTQITAMDFDYSFSPA